MEGAEELYETKAGQQMTVWENNENRILQRTAIRRLNSELKALEIPGKSGFSRREMGSVEANQILASIRSIKKLEEKTGYEYNRIKIRLQDLGSSDFKMIKSIIFKENFMKAVESYSNLDGYDLLTKKLNRMKNPINFYNLIKNSDVFSDIFLYYKPGDGLVYGNFKNDQERFNYGLEELGIVEEEKERLIKRYEKINNDEMVLKAKNIKDANDLISFLKENSNKRR